MGGSWKFHWDNLSGDGVCLCVCLSASISPELHVESSPNYLRMWPWLGRRTVLLWRCCDTSMRRVILYIMEYTHTLFTALCPGLPGRADTRKVKPIWILLKQETVSGSGISWAICKSAPRSRQITTPAPDYSVFYRPDALPAAQPTASKHHVSKTSIF